MTSIAKRIAKLSPAKRRVLAQQIARDRRRGSEETIPPSGETIPPSGEPIPPSEETIAPSEETIAPSGEPITPQPRGRGLLPLSFSQERLWFLHQLEPEGDAYHLYYSLRIEGTLAVPALRAGFQEVVRRHESLRTTFVAGNGTPAQVVHAPPAFALPVVALDSLPRAARQTAVKRLTSAAAARPFDLARGPLLRALLLRLAPAEHVLLLSLHHIISDGWSLGVLIRELTALYQATLHGRPSPLPELKIQFADYALWQRRWLQGEVLRSQLAYWRRQLAGAPPLLELPTDRPRSLRRGIRGHTHMAHFAPALHAGLKALSAEQRCTPFVTLLAAFAVLLGRVSGQSDVVVGSPIANRRRTEVEGLIGLVLNTLVLRLDLTGDSGSRDPQFTELLSRTRERVLDAFTHQDLPFSRLVEALQPERSVRQRPFFQVLFVLQNAPRHALELPGLRIATLESDEQAEDFDCTLFLEEEPGGELAARMKYSVELFDGTTIRRLLKHLGTLCEGIVADPRRRLSEMPIFAPAERHQLVREWNDTRRGEDRSRRLDEMFAAQAERTPDAVAVAAGDAYLSYRELDQRANRLAHRLRSRGVGPEDVAAICLERSPEMVIALVAVLKAGGAYLPLDPSYPEDRLAYMLADSRARVLLSEEALAARFRPSRSPAALLCCDRGRAAMRHRSATRPVCRARSENPAYVLYTSGSTGRPKGVVIPHRAIANHMLWMAAALPLAASDRVLQKTPFSFDASVWEFWAPLLAGARLVLARPGDERDPAALVETLRSRCVTIVQMVPSLLQALTAEPRFAACLALRRVFCGGEALTRELAERYFATGLEADLFNLYGPAEATIDATAARCPRNVPGAAVALGRPIANLRIYLLDAHQQPVPVGAAGELHIAGPGLARGYLGQPRLTAERFLPDPFACEAGGRLYRSGDLARCGRGGTPEFLGRIDHQVKLRGVRIELGEIEALVAQHPAIAEAVVVARNGGGEDRLVAYLVGAEVHAPALRAWLKRKLPETMVPAAFVELPALPLTANGKVDLAALPAPERREAAARVGPRTPVEELLAGIWSEVLGVAEVGIHDDFYELGGHSLLATQVVSRIREALRVELPLPRLLEAPTVAELAAAVDALRAESPGIAAPPMVRVPRDQATPLPLSYAQQRLWFLDQLEPGSSLYNIPHALRLDGAVSTAVLARVFNEVVRRHEALRTTFAMEGGRPRQVIAAELELPLPVIDLGPLPPREREAEAERLATDEARRPFDLRRGPLLRVTLVRLAANDQLALVNLHHIVADGWSFGVLVDEVTALYKAFSRGEAAPAVPEPPLQYADFASWQRQWLTGEVLEAELAYWRGELAGVPRLELPTDRPRPAVQSFPGRQIPVPLSEELNGGLLAFARRQGATRFMTLVAAFQALLSRWSGQTDVVVGSPIAGRTRREIEGLIGFFVNTLVLRTDLSGEPVFRELLARVRQVALDAYAHQELPFERLVEDLARQRDLGSNPLFQVMLALQNAPRANAELPGLKLRPLPVQGGTAKFDLTLLMSEVGAGGALEYNTDLFDATTMERFAAHFVRLLGAIREDPERRLGDLPILSAVERHQLLEAWNDTGAPLPRAAGVAELVAAQAVRTPERVALVFGDRQVSYRELEGRSNRLAHALRGLGAGPEVPVGMAIERSIDLIVAMLGVFKSGGFLVPLDRTLPAERLAFILEDAGVELILTRGDSCAHLPPHGANTVFIEALPKTRERNRERGAAAENLAYLIYTSGTTGRPKGISMTHRVLTNLIGWQLRSTLPLRATLPDAGKRIPQFAPLSFDIIFQETFSALCAGGTLFLLTEEERRDAVLLVDRLEKYRIERLHLPFVALQQLCEVAAEKPPRALREVITAGEQLQVSRSLERFFTAAACTLENQYGPSECHVVSYHPLRGAPRDWTALPPIGRGIGNFRIYLLDSGLRPVPVGVAGEVCLSGPGMARGYFHRPELTAASFIPDPYSATGERLYRTGDLARLVADGNLEFMGRIDHQVKIRGYRIELGEIETVLGAHPGVREAVVLVRGDGPGGIPHLSPSGGTRQLVAYAVPAPEAADVDAGKLRTHLAERLPDYMVPAVVVLLDALPWTPGGKVDRKALPAPERRGTEEGYAAPTDPTEELVAGIWADVLGFARVGVADNFFELGGHSLLATQVISRVREVFAVELPVQKLFEAPTVARLAAVLKAAGEAAGPTVPPILPLPRQGALPPEAVPLSFAQQRLWFIDQYYPGSPMYNLPSAVRLTGRLDRAVLARCLDEIVRRHEALRTRFESAGGRPLQVIAPALAWPLAVVDLRRPAAADREAEARRLASAEARRPFDLARGPLVRAAALQLAAAPDGEEHVVLLTMHHIISDGWSIGVLLRELAALYPAFAARSGPSPLAELPIQYADFAVWQRQTLAGEVLEAELGYWRAQLAGVPQRLELSTDRPHSAVRTFAGKTLPFALSAELSAALAGFSRAHGATLFMTLLAAFTALLARITGETDVVVGTPIAGRNHRQVEDLIGFFVNTLVLRVDLAAAAPDRDPSYRRLLTRVRRVTLGAYEHQDVPFEQLVEELEPQRELATTPLFQVMFALRNVPAARFEVADLVMSREAAEVGASKFDLGMALGETEAGVAGALDYRTALFDRSTIARWAAHFGRLLSGAVEDPDRRLSELPWWSPAERHQLLIEWNDSRRHAPEPTPVDELFAAAAERTPDAIAVVRGADRLSYRELDARAARLARALAGLGVGPESLAALVLEPSPELVVAVVAAMKAGAGYVPLDPAHPRERLELIAEGAGAAVVLTVEALAPPWEERGIPVLRLDRGRPEPPGGREPPAAAPHNLAYVIYTSGSTGRPKGVAVPRANLPHLIAWHRETYRLGPGDRTSQMAGPAFDASVLEIWAALSAGATLCIADQETRTSPDRLISWVTSRAIDVCLLVSPMTELVLTREWPPAAGVRAVLTGGDRLRQRPPMSLRFVLRNHYGPTETTVLVTCGRVAAADRGEGVPDIGRPIPGVRVHLLDRTLRPVPAATPGELCVGGPSLARGYLEAPALTAERFVPDPFGSEAGGRLYRSGDLARYRRDGVIEFLGRIDHQVKVRGFRIELGEIESVLAQHPAVAETVVVTCGQHLVAYVVAVAGAVVESAELRALLRRKLPEAMVPAAFVELPALPLTVNGKVDLAALPAPERREEDWVGPRTPIEERLAGIWSEVLEVRRVGVHDDFFELGGHSLLATQVISRVRETFATRTPLGQLFATPTVAGLAAVLDDAVRQQERPRATPIVPAPRAARMPPSYSQQREWFLEQLEPGSPAYIIPAAMRIAGPLDLRVLAAGLDEIVRRHEPLRTTFPEVDGQPVQVISPPIRGTLPLADLTALPTERRAAAAERLVAEALVLPFDLARGPLLRVKLLRLAPEEHVACLTMHHIISDGWSMSLLIREWIALYAAFLDGKPSPLPELRVQYADYAVAQRRWLQGEDLERLTSYWRQRLGSPPPVLALPTDRPRPARPTLRSRTLPLPFDPELTTALRALSGRLGISLFMTLLSVFKTLLRRTTGQNDLCVGTFIAGRNRPEIEPMIGFFINTLALRTDLGGGPTFRELAERVREVTLGAYEHQDLPFEMLLDALQVERSLSHTPLFQVMLVLQNVPQGNTRLAGLRWSPFGSAGPRADFDLTLWLNEGEDELDGWLEYNAVLWDETTVRRLRGHFRRLLRAALRDPGRPLAAMPLLSAAERQQLTREWSRVPAAVRYAPTFRELFEAQAASRPQAAAVIDAASGLELTYGELNSQANRLAHYLRARGVRPEVRVALLLERSRELLAGILGVLKTGGAYLPLDPGTPRERLARILDDAGIAMLLTHRGLEADLPEAGLPDAAGEVIVLERDGERIAACSAENLGVDIPSSGAAYVITTSGSTGRPKGVVVSHRSLAWYSRAAIAHYGLVPEDRVLQFSSLSFDNSVEEIFPPLARGATVVLRTEEMASSTAELVRGLREWSITALSPPTAFWHELAAGVADGSQNLPASLRILCVGGERMLADPLRRWRSAVGRRARLMNTYGPTETTVVATVCDVTGTDDAEPPVGRPVPNARVYVLDPDGRPVPAGVAGELVIGGDGVARGYLDRPAATAERFIPAPDGFGERLYRTGDLARFLPDGRLVVLGRIDHQVKIRGFRVEPGEIEAVLARHPGVEEAAAIVREAGPEVRQLVAWVAAPPPGPDAGELRGLLAAELPEYMMPAAFVRLDALPRTASGKIDRVALARRAPEEPEAADDGYVPPSTETEEALATIFAQVLGRDRVGVYDSFFELGGHSLLTTRLLSRIRRTFRVDLPLAEVFAAPTVADLAILVENLVIAELEAMSDEDPELSELV